MFLQINLSCSLMITWIARIFDFFMYRLNMSFQNPLLGSLMITLIARIFSFHVQTEYESPDVDANMTK